MLGLLGVYEESQGEGANVFVCCSRWLSEEGGQVHVSAAFLSPTLRPSQAWQEAAKNYGVKAGMHEGIIKTTKQITKTMHACVKLMSNAIYSFIILPSLYSPSLSLVPSLQYSQSADIYGGKNLHGATVNKRRLLLTAYLIQNTSTTWPFHLLFEERLRLRP